MFFQEKRDAIRHVIKNIAFYLLSNKKAIKAEIILIAVGLVKVSTVSAFHA
jgi:hypothetical protein